MEDFEAYSRIRSLKIDNEYVKEVFSRFPSVRKYANLRCGRWYFRPSSTQDDGECYFKSTDGHRKNTKFSLKRLNLHVLRYCCCIMSDVDIKAEDQGILIVDSTKNRKKRFPDSMNRTIPIWCYMMNKYVLGDENPEIHFPSYIDEEERNMIMTRIIPEISAPFSNLPILASIRDFLVKEGSRILPMRCCWISPGYTEMIQEPERYFKLYLVNTTDFERMSNDPKYIGAAGDDEEAWRSKLDDSLNVDILFSSIDKTLESEEGCIDRIREAVKIYNLENPPKKRLVSVQIEPTNVYVASSDYFDSIKNEEENSYHIRLVHHQDKKVEEQTKKKKSKKEILERERIFVVEDHKRYKWILERSLPSIIEYADSVLSTSGSHNRLVISDPSDGKKEAVATSISILLQLFGKDDYQGEEEDEGEVSGEKKTIHPSSFSLLGSRNSTKKKICKDDVNNMLIYFQLFVPDLSPSRNLMKQIHRYFMSEEKKKKKKKKDKEKKKKN